MELNDHLRQMLKDLGQAINESISGSGRVHESIQRIREEGYNLYMVLDAKVGVNRREARGSRRSVAASDTGADEALARSGRAAFRINIKDLRFLKSVGIDPTRKVRRRPARRRAARRVPARGAHAD
jgi:CheY-like chemotaxis protein